MATLRPLNNTVLFQFMDQTGGSQGKFSERTRSGIIIANLNSSQKQMRWGKVVSAGPDAEKQGVVPGLFILIEPLMWTNNEVFEGEKLWKTDTDKIICTTDQESDTIWY